MILLAINWEMWGALGQWAGALITTVAVGIALWQGLEMKKLEYKKNQQEAMISFSMNKKENQLEIILTNVNLPPIFVNKSNLYRIAENTERKQINYQPIEDQRIQAEANKLITQGDICKITVPVDLLIDEANKENKYLYQRIFFLPRVDSSVGRYMWKKSTIINLIYT